MQEQCIIINSFSKTESVPGFRIGYIAGDYDLMRFVRPKQLAIMNPPNIPTIAVWLTMLFRCLYMSEQYEQTEKERQRIIRCFKRVFLFTTPLCSQKIRNYISNLIDERLQVEYAKYKAELFAQERLFASNKKYIEEQLHPFIEESTQMDAGFNYLIKLSTCRRINELEFCQQLLEKTGIAVFTESGFSIKKAEIDNYWIRISLAVQEERFHKAIDRLRLYLFEMEEQVVK